MGLLQGIKEIKITEFCVYTIVFLSVIAPGLLIIFLYKPALFQSLDSIKLLLFSAALSLPIPTFNTFLMAIIWDLKEGGREAFEELVMLTMASSFLVLYIAIAVAYLRSLDFKGFLFYVLILNVSCAAYAFVCSRIKARKKEQRHNG